MKGKIQKWGNSLALRIPRALAEEASLDSGAVVDLSIQEGHLVVKRAAVPEYRLEDLLAQITDENRHGEIDFGPPVGNEVW
jgi:antitoxin MazE